MKSLVTQHLAANGSPTLIGVSLIWAMMRGLIVRNLMKTRRDVTLISVVSGILIQDYAMVQAEEEPAVSKAVKAATDSMPAQMQDAIGILWLSHQTRHANLTLAV